MHTEFMKDITFLRNSTLSKLLSTMLVVSLFSVASLIFPSTVSAEVCGSASNGTCRVTCAADEVAQFERGFSPNHCSEPTKLCCTPKPAISSCNVKCIYEVGCVCPSNCVNPTAAGNATCGGVQVNLRDDGGSSTVFGTIRQPAGTERFGGKGEIGILAFVSLLIRIFTIIAGLIVLFNFIISGYTYLTSEGNPKAHETVKNQITYSVIGIVIIVSAYTITALLSLIFFGSATFILNPTITPPTP